MASSKLLLPSSVALFQSSPVSSTAFCCDKHRHVPSLRLLQPQPVSYTYVLDAASTVRFSHDAEPLSFLDELLSSDDEDEEESEVHNNGEASAPGASAADIEGALSKYVWSQPRRESVPLSREDRDALVDSIVSTELNLLKTLDRVCYKLSPSDFGNVLRQLLEGRKWDKVDLVFNWMKVNRKLKPKSVTSYISMMGKSGQYYRAVGAYKGITNLNLKRDVFICNALLKVVVNAGNVARAFYLFEEMKSIGFVPNVYSYSTLIAGCAKLKNGFEKAKSYMDEMSSKGLKPHPFVYSSILHVCARCGLEDKAKAFFEEMQAHGMKPAVFHYAPMVNMYAEIKKPEEAEKVFEDLMNNGLHVTEVIMNSLLKAYLNVGKLDKARRLFAKMPSFGCSPGDVTYTLMMDAYCKASQVDKAQILFDKMKKKRIAPGKHAYSVLISAYAKLGKADMVSALSKEVEDCKQRLSDPVLFNSILKSYCELGMMDDAMNVLKYMNVNSISPDRATFNILICFFCKQKMLDLAIHTIDDLKDRKIRPNMNSYAPLILELSNAGRCDEALKLYSETKELQVPIPNHVFCAMIEGLSREKRLDEAVKYLKEMLDMGLSPLPSCVGNIVSLAASNPEILDQFLQDGLIPSAVLRQVNMASVLNSFEERGCYSSMHKLLDCMEKRSITVSSNDDEWANMIHNLEQDGQTEIVSKLGGQISKMEENAVSIEVLRHQL